MRNERMRNEKGRNEKKVHEEPPHMGSPHGFLSAMKPEKGVVWILGFRGIEIENSC